MWLIIINGIATHYYFRPYEHHFFLNEHNFIKKEAICTLK